MKISTTKMTLAKTGTKSKMRRMKISTQMVRFQIFLSCCFLKSIKFQMKLMKPPKKSRVRKLMTEKVSLIVKKL